MIGAICFKVTSEYQARIYPVGTYNLIDWEKEEFCILGTEYSCYSLKEPTNNSFIDVAQRTDGVFTLRLIETKQYILRLVCESNVDMALPRFQNENNKSLKINKDKESVMFQFINYLGRSRITFGEDENQKSISFEVVPDKINYEEDYISLTEALDQVCAGLLMENTGSTSNVFRQSKETTDSVFEQFIFLRKFCYSQNLEVIFASIKRNPDRLLIREDEMRPVGQGVPSKKFYSNPFSFSKGWQRNCSNEGGYLYLPQEVSVTQKQDILDTPANRFIKFALEKFDDICIELIRILNTNDNTKQVECLSEAIAIHEMLGDIFNDSFFDDIGILNIMPQNNQVLQKREGYSQIFEAYSMLELALQLDWKGKNDVYEAESKNVALLYEYWLFFELYKIIRAIDGCELVHSKEDSFLTIDVEGITVSLEQGKKSCQSFIIEKLHTKANLYYNRTFSPTEFQTTRYEGSYSRPFRPDYTLAVFPDTYSKGRYNGEEMAIKNGAVSYVHFDAKYRVTDIASLVGKRYEEGFIDDKIDEVINTYKRGDLLKMHTYNDAIRRTIGSYVLYPGENNTTSQTNETFRLYDEILPGVGAFAIKPSIEEQCENELRTFITELLEEKGTINSRLNRMKHYTEMVLREPSINSKDVSRAIITECVKSERGDCCVLGYIRADADEDYYFSLRDNGLLKNGSEFLFYFYAIKGTEVYSHHKDVFKAEDFCFYTNQINKTKTYKPEPVLCKIVTNELMSRRALVERLGQKGIVTIEERHQADFYYVLTVNVVNDNYRMEELDVAEISIQNGNDTFSPHSPKVLVWGNN